jgi:hypothetical protein
MARELTRSELPYETYERLTGKKWTSGKAADVVKLLEQYGIMAPAGSEQANNALQRALKADKTLVGERPTLPEPRGITPGAIPKVGSDVEAGYQRMKEAPAGKSAISRFSPDDFNRIESALPAAAAIYGTGAGLGLAGGLTAGAAGTGLADMSPEIFTKAVRDAISQGNRAQVEALLKNAEQAARSARGGAQRMSHLGRVDELRSALQRMLNPLD